MMKRPLKLLTGVYEYSRECLAIAGCAPPATCTGSIPLYFFINFFWLAMIFS